MRMAPKSRTLMSEQTLITSSMSCSTSRTPMPASASWHSRSPSSSLSVSLRPEDGSSSSSRRGRVGSERASSSSRACPVGSVSAPRPARCVNPTRARTSSALAPALERSCDQRRRISAAARTFSRTEREPKISSRWKVRAMPSRARLWGVRPVMSAPSKVMGRAVMFCRPQMALKHVVLPAPLGPMRPVTEPASTVRFTPRNACTPPKRTSACATSRSGIWSPPNAVGPAPRAPRPEPPCLLPSQTRFLQSQRRTGSTLETYGRNFRGRAGSVSLTVMEHSMAERLADLAERKNEALNAGSPRAVENHHAKGKLTARERIDYLLDEGSFQELDMLARHRAHGMGLEDNRPYTDGVVTGFGTIDGRRVCIFSQDFTVFGGALGEVFAEKIHKVMDLAASTGVPMIGLNDGAGARIQEGVVSLHSYGGIFHRNVTASGVIPQISVILGPCAGGAVYSPAMTDFIFMVQGTSHMFITGPDVVKTVTGEDVTLEELGGAMSHATKSGVATFVSPDEKACMDDVRHLLSFLPANNLEEPPLVVSGDEPDRAVTELVDFLPTSPNH